ncbi:MAG: gliding motility-associated C-terminal domain-containing protein, partial [Bacteroidales bacterium]|nr:gliding motility-associated C-terminal domain-containing protein [Bacteroidales bacterium]
GAITGSTTSTTISGLATGTYTYTVTNAVGCTSVASANVVITAQPATPTVPVVGTITQPTCTVPTGSVVLSGLPAGNWTINPGAITGSTTSTTISGLATGTYTYTVTNAVGCTSVAAANVTITQPAAALTVITTYVDVACFGGTTGSATATAAGGTGVYTYSWNTSTVQTTATATELIAGPYTVTVTDANSCTATANVTITQPAAALSGSTVVANVLCNGGSTGSVDLTVTGVTAPYTFLWSNGATTEDLTNVVAGNYTVTITDANSCTANSAGNVTEPAAALSGTTVDTNVLCFGAATGSVDLTVTGGTTPFTFLWNNGATTEDLTNVVAGNYTVTIIDANSCTFTTSATITQPLAALAGSITSQTNVSCFGSANGSVTITGAGGTSPYMYSLNGETYQASGTFTGLTAATYAITVRDANLCTTNVSATVTEPAVLSLANTKEDASCPDVDDGKITLTITGGTQPYSVIWSDGILTADRLNIPDGTYSVVVTDLNGCAASLDVVVGIIGSEKCIEVPEVITPNNDGYNDTWKIKNIDLFPNAEVFVFSRWGKLVFRTKNIPANPWDGTFKGKLLPTDSYHYVLHLNDGSEPRSGVISIIR